MTTKKNSTTVSHSSSHSHAGGAHSTAPAVAETNPEASSAPVLGAGAPAVFAAPPAAPPPAPLDVTPARTSVTGGTLTMFLEPPPPTANIPATPTNYVAQTTNYRGTAPKKAELLALPMAVADLRKFAAYPQVIGGTAPPYAEMLHIFEVTNAWSSMRVASTAWDNYCVDQEGICWRIMRAGMDRLKPAFDLAVAGNPSLGNQLAGLATLLGVKKEIAKKAVSTKKANKKALADGTPAVHGQVGKKRKKKADKAIVDAATSGHGAGGATAVTPAPVAVAAPSGAQAAVAPVAAPIVALVSAPAVAGTAGVAAAPGAVAVNGSGAAH